jgi:hypothetical protein
MYLQKVISKKLRKEKEIFFVGILKVTDELNRIRIRKSVVQSANTENRIRTKMTRIRNTACLLDDGRIRVRTNNGGSGSRRLLRIRIHNTARNLKGVRHEIFDFRFFS